MASRNLFSTIRQAGRNWRQDQAAQLGAALAYYTLFSVAPLLIIAIAIAGLAYGEQAAKGEVVHQLEQYVSKESAFAIQGLIESAHRPQTSVWATALGLAAMLFGALGLFTQLKSALNRIWRLESKEANGWTATLKNYLVALIMVLVTGLSLLGLLAASTVVSLLIDYLGEHLPGSAWAWRGLDGFVSFGLLTFLFMLLFRFMSDRQLRYGVVWKGAVATALLFVAGKVLFGYYLAYSNVASAYGAAGSLVIFLIWVYYSAQILFFGAELIRVETNK